MSSRFTWKKVGALACLGIYFGAAEYGVGDLSEAVVLCSIWLVFLVLGARWQIVAVFFQARGAEEILASRRSSWTHGALLAAAVTCVVLLFFSFDQQWLGVIAVALPLSYGFGKLSCMQAGCCGFPQDRHLTAPIPRVPLQALEAISAAICVVILLTLLTLGYDPRCVLGASAVMHGALRLASLYLRRLAPKIDWLMIGFGLAILAA